jgi:hypothetical protein
VGREVTSCEGEEVQDLTMALASSPLEKSSRYGICHIYEMTFEASSPIVKAVLTAHRRCHFSLLAIVLLSYRTSTTTTARSYQGVDNKFLSGI